jgi:hypothetical protein
LPQSLGLRHVAGQLDWNREFHKKLVRFFSSDGALLLVWIAAAAAYAIFKKSKMTPPKKSSRNCGKLPAVRTHK